MARDANTLAHADRRSSQDHIHRSKRLGSRRSVAMTFGSLHEVAASSGLCAVTLQPGPHRWFFSTSGRGRRQQSGATLALTLRAAQCIKRRLYLQPKVARSPSWIRTRCIAEGRNARFPFISSCSSTSSFAAYAATAASKCAPSFHSRPSSTASFLATATRARFGPIVLTSLRPQFRRAKRFLTVVKSTLAAS